MTISRPCHGRAGNNGRDVYRSVRVSCICRPRATPSVLLGLHIQQPSFCNGAQQALNSRHFIKSRPCSAARGLQLTEAASITSQEATTTKVRLCLQHQVAFGQVLKVVGSGPKLGDWRADHAQELQWTEGHVWTGELQLEPGSYEFKCVIAAGDQIVSWEPGSNRILQVPSGVRGIRVEGIWSRTADQRITVTESASAVSVAARQKRAAAARLLAKALEEVNAAAAASGPSAAALAARRRAAAGPAAAPAGEAAGGGSGGDKRSLAEALEAEALRELQELLGSDAGGSSSVSAGSGGDGHSSNSAPAAQDGVAGAKAQDSAGRVGSAAAEAAGVGADANGTSRHHSRGAGAVSRFAVREGKGGEGGEGVGQSDVAAAAVGKQQSTVGKGRRRGATASGWRDLLSSATPEGEQQVRQQAQEQQKVSAGAAEAAAGGIAQSIREAAAARGEPLAFAAREEASSSSSSAGADPTAIVSGKSGSSAGEPERPPKVAASTADVAQSFSTPAAAAVQEPLAEVPRSSAGTAAAAGDLAGVAAAEKKAEAPVDSAAAVTAAVTPADPAAAEAANGPTPPVVKFAAAVGVESRAAEGEKTATPAVKPAAQAGETSAKTAAKGADDPRVAEPSDSAASRSVASGAEKGRRLSWRQLLGGSDEQQGAATATGTGTSAVDEQGPAVVKAVASAEQTSQQAVSQSADAGGEKAEQKQRPQEEQAGEGKEESVSSRFARLLTSTLLKKEPVAGAGEQVSEAPTKQQQPAAAVVKPAASAQPAAEAPPTPPGRDTKVPSAAAAAAAEAPADTAVAPGSTSSSGEKSSSKPDGIMGAGSSREEGRPSNAGPESLSDPDLDRLVDAWDAAWSQGRGKTQTSTGGAASGVPAARKEALTANGSSSSGGAPAQPVSASRAGSSGQPRPGVPAASSAAAATAAGTGAGSAGKHVNGGSISAGGSSGESLYSIAERLTSGTGPALVPGGAADDSSPGVTVRLGATAAMGVDRQGSFDNRSSYLSQSLLTESANGSLGGAAGNGEQPSTALLRQLRAANAANGKVPGATDGAAGAGTVRPFPNLPATPAPAGILSSMDDDEENGNDTQRALPATPPPPSYLSGPAGGGSKDAAVAPAVPPLPATPVAFSILSGGLGGVGAAAEDLLRRASDADAVLSMLRGNLPLTPVNRGGRGGAAGPLSLVEDQEETEDDDDTEGVNRGKARGRRLRPRPVSLLPVPGAVADSQIDPVAAARAAAADAAQALEQTRAAIQALQQNAAALGLSPEALAEMAARLLQQLPKLDTSVNPEAPTAPALPPAVSQLATTLASGLGTVGSGLTEQLRKASSAAAAAAAAAAAKAPESPSSAAADGNAAAAEETKGVVGANGANGAAPGNLIASVVAPAPTGGPGGVSLLSGLFSGLVGGVSGAVVGSPPLPPGCVRLVAGAHMIPHVDKVQKGGEDAYFISRVGLGGVGVADGVSGWADEGIDPAEYPRTLMRFAADAYEAARGAMSAQDIIRYAQYRTYLKGSSTVCMALMKPGRKLEIANVGDSGVRILRNGKVIFGTEAQQHAFNMPYQLSHPNNVEDPDSADDADVHLLDVQEGDVIMLATDGLFDNVFDEEIEQIVSHQLRELAAAGRGKAPAVAVAVTAVSATVTTAESTGTAANGTAAVSSSSGSSGAGGSGGAGAGGRGSKGLLSQSLSAAAAAAASAAGGAAAGAAGGRSGGGGVAYRPEDAARVARALAERAHLHARNPTQRTPWSVTSSQQPNFMWAKFFAKGGGKMDDCTVLVAFVCGSE